MTFLFLSHFYSPFDLSCVSSTVSPLPLSSSSKFFSVFPVALTLHSMSLFFVVIAINTYFRLFPANLILVWYKPFSLSFLTANRYRYFLSGASLITCLRIFNFGSPVRFVPCLSFLHPLFLHPPHSSTSNITFFVTRYFPLLEMWSGF